MSTTGPRSNAFTAFRHRDFRVFWCAALVSNIGTWMQLITVPYVLDQMTHSTAVVGLGAFLAFLPTAALGPLSGSLADRYPRRTVMLWTQAASAIAAMGLWVVWVTGAATTASLLVLVAVAACAQGLTMGAWMAFVTQLVPTADMLHAVRLNQAQFVTSRALGPTLAGLVLAAFGPGPAFLINGLSYVLVVAAVLTIATRPAVAPTASRAVIAHFREAVRYTRRYAALGLAVMAAIVFVTFGNSAMQLTEPFTRNVLDVGPGVYGLLFGVYGLGSLVAMPIVLLRVGTRRSRLLVIGFAGFALGEAALGAAPAYGAALVAVFVMGISNVPLQMSVQTSLQHHVDDEHRGRVMSMYIMASFGGLPIGALIGGIVAEQVGLRATIVGGACLLAVLAVVVSRHYGGVDVLDGDPVTPTSEAPEPVSPHLLAEPDAP